MYANACAYAYTYDSNITLSYEMDLIMLTAFRNLAALRNNQLRMVEDGCLKIVDRYSMCVCMCVCVYVCMCVCKDGGGRLPQDRRQVHTFCSIYVFVLMLMLMLVLVLMLFIIFILL
jgi:hypothetical protein